VAWQYLDLADFLLIAEAVLDLPAEDLARAARMDLADSALHAPAAEFGGVEFYPDLARKTAVLASRLIRNCLMATSGSAICARWSSSPATMVHGPIRPTTRRVTRPLPSSKGWLPARSTRTSCATGSAAGWRDYQSVPEDPRGKRYSPSRPGKDRPVPDGPSSPRASAGHSRGAPETIVKFA
jgi:hypothetical protein